MSSVDFWKKLQECIEKRREQYYSNTTPCKPLSMGSQDQLTSRAFQQHISQPLVAHSLPAHQLSLTPLLLLSSPLRRKILFLRCNSLNHSSF